MAEHLVLYDGTCGLCSWVVQFLLKADSEEHFVFAPLQGETASAYLKHLPESVRGVDSVVLIENYQDNPQAYVLSKGALRICWLLGGGWRVPGVLSFLPAFIFDWAYNVVARNRYQWVARSCLVPQKKDRHRFLP